MRASGSIVWHATTEWPSEINDCAAASRGGSDVPDLRGSADFLNPKSVNQFACGSDPINSSDPCGLLGRCGFRDVKITIPR